MEVKPFCNKCLQSNPKSLLVTSCRHVVCSECYEKSERKCAYCRAACKVLRFGELPPEMSSYFDPYLPALQKFLKIARFQLHQRSIWTEQRRGILDRMHRRRAKNEEKKQNVAAIKKAYKEAVKWNLDLKEKLKKARRTEPCNPFEMNSNRGQQQQQRFSELVQKGPNASNTRNSFNTSSRSTESSRSNSNSTGISPSLGATPGRLNSNSTVTSNSFFNGTSISASSSFDGTMGSSRGSNNTSDLRRLLLNSHVRSPCVKF